MFRLVSYILNGGTHFISLYLGPYYSVDYVWQSLFIRARITWQQCIRWVHNVKTCKYINYIMWRVIQFDRIFRLQAKDSSRGVRVNCVYHKLRHLLATLSKIKEPCKRWSISTMIFFGVMYYIYIYLYVYIYICVPRPELITWKLTLPTGCFGRFRVNSLVFCQFFQLVVHRCICQSWYSFTASHLNGTRGTRSMEQFLRATATSWLLRSTIV